MKQINAMELISGAAVAFNDLKKELNSTTDPERARKLGNYGLGMINGLAIAMNAMISMENNSFTGDFDDWLTSKHDEIEQAVKIKILEHSSDQEKEQ